MGLIEKFRKFKENRFEKSVKKNLVIIQKTKVLQEDRAAAIDFFKSLKEAEIAVPAMLKRFDFSLEHGINDTREKESCMEGILAHKEKALEHILEHLKKTNRIAWPIKIYSKLVGEDELIKVLLEVINYEDVSFDQSKVDKNYDILCYLMDYKLPDGGQSLLSITKDHDERVRYAAAEAILEQKKPEVVSQLEPFLFDESPENIRIRQAVVEAYCENAWTIQSKDIIQTGEFLGGYVITKELQIKKYNN